MMTPGTGPDGPVFLSYFWQFRELPKLIEAANSVCERSGKWPELVVLRQLGIE